MLLHRKRYTNPYHNDHHHRACGSHTNYRFCRHRTDNNSLRDCPPHGKSDRAPYKVRHTNFGYLHHIHKDSFVRGPNFHQRLRTKGRLCGYRDGLGADTGCQRPRSFQRHSTVSGLLHSGLHLRLRLHTTLVHQAGRHAVLPVLLQRTRARSCYGFRLWTERRHLRCCDRLRCGWEGYGAVMTYEAIPFYSLTLP